MGDHELSGLLPGVSSSVFLFSDPEDEEKWATAELKAAELIERLQPSTSSDERRKDVADWVEGLIYRNFDCKVFTFGSVPLKTYLPDGDIDLTAFGSFQLSNDIWANDLRSVLENEERNKDAKFRVKEVQCIHAEVQIVKCLVENIIVDISFNQLGGLCTLCFLEQVDRLIGKDHLFKRSIILVKAWCYYESRILGAHHGLISTYALETLVLYIFHIFHCSLRGPLEVLFRFLDFFSKFDWENYCLSLGGPIPLSSLPEMAAEPPQRSGRQLLLSQAFLDACTQAYTVFPRSQDTHGRTFPPKFLNIVDPLRINNNLGRSVSKGNFFRIRSAFSYGAKKLENVLHSTQEELDEKFTAFFLNTERHGSGCRPDAPAPAVQNSQGEAVFTHFVDEAKNVSDEGNGQLMPESAKGAGRPFTYPVESFSVKKQNLSQCENNELYRPLDLKNATQVIIPSLDGVSTSEFHPTKGDACKGRNSNQTGKAKQGAICKGEEPSPAILESSYSVIRGRGGKELDCNKVSATVSEKPRRELESNILPVALTTNGRGHIENAKDLATCDQCGCNRDSLFDESNVNSGDSRVPLCSGLSFFCEPRSTDAISSESSTVSFELGSSTLQTNSPEFCSKMNHRKSDGLETGERHLEDDILARGRLYYEPTLNSAGDFVILEKYEEINSSISSGGLDFRPIEMNRIRGTMIRDEETTSSRSSPIKFAAECKQGMTGALEQPSLLSVSGQSEISVTGRSFQSISAVADPSASIVVSCQSSRPPDNVEMPDDSHLSHVPFLTLNNVPNCNDRQISDGNLGSDLSITSHERKFSETSSKAVIAEADGLGVGNTLMAAGIPMSAGLILDTEAEIGVCKESAVKYFQTDILKGDFTAHLNNLEVGRSIQASYLHGPLFIPSPSMLPQRCVKGYFPWEGPGRPTTAGRNGFTQISGYGHGLFPVSPLHSANMFPMPNGFPVEELPKSHKGTGTYLPNMRPPAYRDRPPTAIGRGQRASNITNHHDQASSDGPHPFASRYRGMGRGQRKHDTHIQVNMFNSRSEKVSVEKGWDAAKEETIHVKSLHSPLINFSTNENNFIYPGRKMGKDSLGHGADWTPAAPDMVYPYVGSNALITEDLRFGSLGSVHTGCSQPVNRRNAAAEIDNIGCIFENHYHTKDNEPTQSSDKLSRKLMSHDHQQSTSQLTYELKEEDFPPLPFCGQLGRPNGYNIRKNSTNQGSHYQACLVGPSS